MRARPDAWFIYKPICSSRGAGIEILNARSQLPDRDAIAQEYIASPLLLQGFKFDFRVYLLLFSVAPLCAFVYRDGIARVCTEPFAPPGEGAAERQGLPPDPRAHLTNFEVSRARDEPPRTLYVGETDEAQIVDLAPGLRSK